MPAGQQNSARTPHEQRLQRLEEEVYVRGAGYVPKAEAAAAAAQQWEALPADVREALSAYWAALQAADERMADLVKAARKAKIRKSDITWIAEFQRDPARLEGGRGRTP